MKRSKNPSWRSGVYLGVAASAAGSWDIFCAEHYLQRAKERTGEEYLEAIFHFADIFEKAFSSEPFIRFAMLNSKTYDNDRKISPQRFQIRDRIRGLSHFFEMDARLREVYLLTVCKPPEWQKNVFAKRGYIILDVSPEKTDSEIVISMYDWRFSDQKRLLGRTSTKNEVIG